MLLADDDDGDVAQGQDLSFLAFFTSANQRLRLLKAGFVTSKTLLPKALSGMTNYLHRTRLLEFIVGDIIYPSRKAALKDTV